MEFSKEQLNIILGALNCYVEIESLPIDLKNEAQKLHENIKKIVKQC